MKFENIYIAMVNPENPCNIGSAARAMRTCGLSKMILINPCTTDHEDIRKMAHRSLDIVENAQIFPSLDEALQSMHLTIGTTMRRRAINFPYFTPEEVASRVFSLKNDLNTALVFGNERNGLSNEELNLCQIRSTIPIATQNPALNLAQAIMVYCYSLYSKSQSVNKRLYNFELAGHKKLESFYNNLSIALQSKGFNPRDDMETFISRIRRLIGRSLPENRDIQLLHKVINVLSGKDKGNTEKK